MKYELIEKDRLLILIPNDDLDCFLLGQLSYKTGSNPKTIIASNGIKINNLTLNINELLTRYIDNNNNKY